MQVRQLQPGAVASWWQPGHPGWAIYPVDSEQFMSTGALESVSVPNEQILAPPPTLGGVQASALYSIGPALCAWCPLLLIKESRMCGISEDLDACRGCILSASARIQVEQILENISGHPDGIQTRK